MTTPLEKMTDKEVLEYAERASDAAAKYEHRDLDQALAIEAYSLAKAGDFAEARYRLSLRNIGQS